MMSAGEYSKVQNLKTSVAETLNWYRQLGSKVSSFSFRDEIWRGYEDDPLRFTAENPGMVTFFETWRGMSDGFQSFIIEGGRFSKHSIFPPLALAVYAIGRPVSDGIKTAWNSSFAAVEAKSSGDRAAAMAGAFGGVSGVGLTFLGSAQMAVAAKGMTPMIGTVCGSGSEVAVAGATATASSAAGVVAEAAGAVAGAAGGGVFAATIQDGGEGGGTGEVSDPDPEAYLGRRAARLDGKVRTKQYLNTAVRDLRTRGIWSGRIEQRIHTLVADRQMRLVEDFFANVDEYLSAGRTLSPEDALKYLESLEAQASMRGHRTAIMN